MGNVFKINTLENNYRIGNLIHQGQGKIISEAKPKYISWYWRLLEFLSFGTKFKPRFEYNVQKIQLEQHKGLGAGLGLRS